MTRPPQCMTASTLNEKTTPGKKEPPLQSSADNQDVEGEKDNTKYESIMILSVPGKPATKLIELTKSSANRTRSLRSHTTKGYFADELSDSISSSFRPSA
ncbi:unnamed protein product [Phytophthora fragariaefolia]|uniref:Unnamed protein product n=1 Tax=Phytophthora fragariaefolia TaxID=1490495 RepID=A0A9W6U9P6_9STRA|nr:unnamed protein product [Phytophthora fragariaefolia]